MKGSLLKPVMSVMLVILVLAGCAPPAAPAAPPPPTATPGPLDVVQAFREARAQHDLDGMVSLFTDDAKFIHGGGVTLNGHEGIRQALGYAQGLRYEELDGDCNITQDPKLVKCDFRARMIPYGEYEVQYHLEVVGSKIKTMYHNENPGAAGNKQFGRFVAWGSTTHPDEWKPLWNRANTADWDLALGESFANLYDEWQASLLAPTPAPATADRLEVAQAYADAMAKGDADAALALFADDAKIVDDAGNTSAAGRDAIRDYLAWLMAQEYREIDPECAPAQNPTVIECHGQTRTVLIPVGEAPITYYVMVEDGRIASVNIVETHWDAEATAHTNAFFDWFRTTHPDDYQRFIDLFNQRAYNRQLGELLAGAYHEWETTKVTPTPAPAAADPLDVVQAYRDALADRDAERMAALFADSAKWQGLDGRVFSGPNELRNEFEFLTVLEFKEVTVECKPESIPGFAKCEGGFSFLPWGEFKAAYTVQLKGEQIDRVYWTMHSWDDVQPRVGAFVTWAEAARPEDMALIYKKENAWAFDRELGELIKKLHIEWQATKLTPTPAPATADPLRVVAAFRAALAKHDVDKMVTLFTEDGEWRHNNYHTFTGSAELRNVLDYAVALDYRELRGACALTADKARIRCKVQARNIPYGNFQVTYDVEVAGDKISTLQFTESPDAATQARADEFLGWVGTAHPEDMARIDAAFDKYAFNQELGETLAGLHAEWQAAKPTPVPVAAAVPDVVQKFRDAMAERDIDAVIALFTENGEWRVGGGMTFKGRAELERWIGYVFGLQYREFDATCEGTPQPALTKCEAQATSALFGEHGATYYIEVTGDKITAVLWQDNIGPESGAHADDFARWLVKTYPEESTRIFEGLANQNGYNRELGELIAETYDEWEASQK